MLLLRTTGSNFFMLLSSFDPNLGWEEFQVWLTGRPVGGHALRAGAFLGRLR